jgi:ribosomal protein S18 acetylase RimI-like enzyme
MYVIPKRRHHGVGRALLAYVLDYARALDGLEDLTLAVTAGNEAARNLYLEAGFIPYGVEPHYIRVGTQYYDIEWMHCSVAREESTQTRERRGSDTDGGQP